MYLGIDLGGTKTLVASLNEQGEITEDLKFPTPQDYNQFLQELDKAVKSLGEKTFTAAAMAVPGLIDRSKGIVLALGNLPWRNEPIQADCSKICGCPLLIENDAKLAGLSEAQLHKDVRKVLYLTISTGINSAVVYEGKLDPALIDSEGGHLMFPHDGKIEDWETFASGKAIFNRFGKKAADIDSPEDWQSIVDNWALGFHAHMALIQPDLVIIGGGVGTHFQKYHEILVATLQKYNEALVPTPPIVQAQRPEEAVIFGCYDLIKQSRG